MAYISPDEVRSPKAYWQLIDVLSDGGPEQCAYALGEWEGDRVIGFRWNGTQDNPIGSPQSRGLPVWTILDSRLNEAVISLLPEEKQLLARHFLETATFEGPSITDGGVAFWNMHHKPPVVIKIDFNAIRDLIANSSTSEEDCRLLLQSQSNKKLITDIADFKYVKGQYRVNNFGYQIIDLGIDDLLPVAQKFSTSLLQVRAQWV